LGCNCSFESYAAEKVVFLNVNQKKLSMHVGQKKKIRLDQSRIDYGRTIKWTSSNKKIVKVSKKGVLTAKQVGKVKIKATIVGEEKSASFNVTVKKLKKAKSIKLNKCSKYLFTNDVVHLKAKLTPKRSNEAIVWSSSNENIATVDENGYVTGIAPGKVTITAETDSSKLKCKQKIVVRDNKVTSIKLSDKKKVVGIGKTELLTATVKPTYVTNKKLVWTSSDSKVATVDQNGKVTGKKAGYAVITVAWKDNSQIKTQCQVVVSKASGNITKAMLDKLDLSQVDNLAIVAHPDDETIWGGAHLAAENYFVLCLTNGDKASRKTDFGESMDIAQNKYIILSYPDLNSDGTKNNWDFEQLSIIKDIETVLTYKKWNTVVTHNPNGEYGHSHHMMTSKFVTQVYESNLNNASRFMYFGKYYAPEDLTDAVKKQLVPLNDKMYAIKKEMLDCYAEKQWTCYTWLGHMEPYENWIYYEDWK
jgi:uncharacterized protein YjdB/LmbE family N-acetylglucosaminyl deacetylase